MDILADSVHSYQSDAVKKQASCRQNDSADCLPSLRSYAALMQIYRTMNSYPSAPLYEIIRGCKDDAYRAHRARMRERGAKQNG